MKQFRYLMAFIPLAIIFGAFASTGCSGGEDLKHDPPDKSLEGLPPGPKDPEFEGGGGPGKGKPGG